MKDIEDDDPTLVELMSGGGLKPATVQDKERAFHHFNEFIKKHNEEKEIKDLLETPEGKGRLEFLFGKYFYCLENGKKGEGRIHLA